MAVIGGERRIVTVLFADIVDSTAISERLGPERFTLLVDEVMRVMSAEVERFDGTVVQYIGDELYAVFGAPVAHEDDSERAIRAALAIQRALRDYAADVEAAYGVELAVRIAINTGPVVIRPQSDDPYNALGDTVNVASRIQKLVAGGEIVIGRTTKAQVETCFSLEDLGDADLRGLAEPVRTFRVVGVLEGEPFPTTASLVGRDFELAVLERVMDDLVDGRGAIVSILGEPGIGKSPPRRGRRPLPRAHPLRRGRAVSYAQSSPYYSIRELLGEWLCTLRRLRRGHALELKAELARLFGAEAENAYPFIGNLLGIKLEPDAARSCGRRAERASSARPSSTLPKLCCHLSREQPLCLVFDDLHWADDSTLELLRKLLATTEEAAVGLVFLYRSEREHGLAPKRARPPAPPASVPRDRAAPGRREQGTRHERRRRGPARVRRGAAHGRAGGNPFFLEEALHDLVERGPSGVGTDATRWPSAPTSWRSRRSRARSRLGSTGSTWKPARC